MARREHHISRSSILHGSNDEETWFDLEQFYQDHIREISQKLTQLDDEIWGKMVLMERNKRIAKAYLRTTTLVVDGGRNGFDGKTLGFNSFDNPFRDAHVEELRAKITEGVALKMDYQGNIIALARGTSPVFVQGWKTPTLHCMSDRIVHQRGRLEMADPMTPQKERAVKVFDMKQFKSCLERALSQSCPTNNHMELIFKSSVRIALVKEANDPIKTPCWFMLINLVALDMLNTKMPQALASLNGPRLNPYLSVSRNDVLSQSMPSQSPSSDIYGTLGDPQLALSQLLAAAISAGKWNQPVPDSEQLAQLASSLALGYGGKLANTVQRRMTSGYLSEGDIIGPQRRSRSSNRNLKSTVRPLSQQCRWGVGQSVDAIYEPIDDEDFDDDDSKRNFTLRPKETEYTVPKKLFPSGSACRNLKPANWSTGSITSDYESSKDLYDSSTVSSASQISTIYANGRRSSSPSVLSEAASESQTSDSGYPDSIRRPRTHSVGLNSSARPTFTLHPTDDKVSDAFIRNRNHRHFHPLRRTKKHVMPLIRPIAVKGSRETLDSSAEEASPESAGEADARTPSRPMAPEKRKRSETLNRQLMQHPVHRRPDNVTVLSLP